MEKKSLVGLMTPNVKTDIFNKMMETMKLKREVATKTENKEKVTIEELVNELVAIDEGTLNALVERIHSGEESELEHRAFRHILNIREEIKRIKELLDEE